MLCLSAVLFSVKNLKKYLAINYFSCQKKLCKDTEIKAFSHWHFEFSMARFWAVPVFCNKIWTVWSAYTTGRLSSTAWSTTQPNLPTQKPSWRWRNISLLVLGLGKNPQKECARLLFAVPFVQGSPKCDPLDSWENGISAKVRVRISRIMPQNVYTRPSFYSCIHVNQRKVVNWSYILRLYMMTQSPSLVTKSLTEVWFTSLIISHLLVHVAPTVSTIFLILYKIFENNLLNCEIPSPHWFWNSALTIIWRTKCQNDKPVVFL